MDNERKQSLANSIIKFLNEATNNVNDEQKESLEVAIQCIESAFELTPNLRANLPVINLLEAIAQQAPPIDNDAAEEHKNAGNTAMRDGDYNRALTEYTLAINYNPDNSVFYCNRAAAYTRLDRNSDAVNDCRRALELDPQYGKAYGRMGIAYSNMQMYQEAKDAYQTALSYDPTNQMYRQNMVIAEQHLGAAQAPPDARRMFEFLNNESFVQMAAQMMNSPEFNNMMSGFSNMPGNPNFDALLEVGSALANQLQQANPNLAQNLRTRFTVASPPAESESDPDEGAGGENLDRPNVDNNPNDNNNPQGDNERN